MLHIQIFYFCFSYKSWWGVPDMPKINYSCEDARKWALDVTSFWIDNFNIDGWRMDVAKEIDLLFWKDFRKQQKIVITMFSYFPKSLVIHLNGFKVICSMEL